MLLGALRSALSAKLRDGELKVVQAFSFEGPKSKTVRAALAKLETKKTVLLVDNDAENRNLQLGARNLAGVMLVLSRDISVYELLRHKNVLVSEAAAKKLSEALSQ